MKDHNTKTFEGVWEDGWEDPNALARSIQRKAEEAHLVKDLQHQYGAPLSRLFHHHNGEEEVIAITPYREEESRHAIQEEHPPKSKRTIIADVEEIATDGAPSTLTRFVHHQENMDPDTTRKETNAGPVWAYVSL